MPRHFDIAERRTVVAEAVCRLAGRAGLDGAGIRDVAAEAGLSIGAVQRCFATKNAMFAFTLDHIGRRLLSRMADAVAAATDPCERVNAAARALILAEPEHRDHALTWLAFTTRAAVDPALGQILQAGYQGLEEALERLMPPQRDVRTLIVLADGLTAHVLLGRLTPDEAAAIMRGHVTDLLGRPQTAPGFVGSD